MNSKKYNYRLLKYINKYSFIFSSKKVFVDFLIYKFPFLSKFYNKKQKYSFKKVSFNPSFITNEKIAVYKVIFGNYDALNEPKILPTNCDFFVITDLIIPNDSNWKKIDISHFHNSNLNNNELNRYYKFHPHLFFPSYKYSLYLDGNIELISDPREFLDSIPKAGISVHNHFRRQCIFDEIDVCINLNKDTYENLNLHRQHLISNNMPLNYGMAELPIILRQHNNLQCIKIMNEWWYEFLNYSKRDQISFPYVLYKNDIKVKEVTKLGEDIYSNYSFRKYGHRIFNEK